MTDNVLNRFEQADASGDNALICDGTLTGSSIQNLETFYLFAYLANMSAVSTTNLYARFPGTLVRAMLVQGEDVTGTAIITFALVSGGTVAGTKPTLSGSKGDTAIFTPTGDNVLNNQTVIDISSDGGSSGACPVYIILELEPS